MSDLAKVLAAQSRGSSVQLVPCEVVTLTPLRVTLNNSLVNGVRVAGLTYTPGPALALWAPPALPLILPIGA